MTTTLQKSKLEGPFAEARLWLYNYALRNKITNNTLTEPLIADWTPYSRVRAGYVLGVIWGRMRQMKSDLEQATEYANLVLKEFENDEG